MFSKSDLLLLSAMQHDARLTAAEMGEACGLSGTAALKRYKKLVSLGEIEGTGARLKPQSLGLTLCMLVLITLERERRSEIDHFKAALRREDRVIHAYTVTGEADFLVMIAAKSIEEYDIFTQEFFYDQHKVKGFKTLVVVDAVKTAGRMPIDVDSGTP